MNQTADLADQINQVAAASVEGMLHLLPRLGGALLLLLVGWILAKVLRALTGRVLVLLDTLLGSVFGARMSSRVRFARQAKVLRALVFWTVLLVFVTAAASVLGLSILTDWLARVLDYLPALFAGIVIVVSGYILSRVVADLILGAPGHLPQAQRLVAARAAQGTVLVAAILVGAEQIGVRVTFLAILAGVVAIAVVGGVVVAISLGARAHVANLIGVQQLGREFAIGQRIRVAGFEGRILDVSAQAVVLETGDGRVSLPGRIFSEQPVVLVARDERND